MNKGKGSERGWKHSENGSMAGFISLNLMIEADNELFLEDETWSILGSYIFSRKIYLMSFVK